MSGTNEQSMAMSPGKSKRSPVFTGGMRLRVAKTRHIAMMLNGMLRKKIQRQPSRLVIRPPTIGPTILAMPLREVASPKKPPCRLLGRMVAGMVNELARSVPPPRPCMPRKTIRDGMLGAMPHRTEPDMNSVTPPMKIGLFPTESASLPEKGSETVEQSR